MKTQKNRFIEKNISRYFLFAATIFLTAIATSCSDTSSNAPDPEPEAETPPEIVTEVYSDQFEIPEDLKVTCLNGEEEPEILNTQSCNVMEWLDHAYWALSFRDNRGSMAILAINSEGEISERWDYDGARYLWKIEVDEEAETATFIGQDKREIVVPWNDLRIE